MRQLQINQNHKLLYSTRVPLLLEKGTMRLVEKPITNKIKIDMKGNKYRLKFKDKEIFLDMKDSNVKGFKRCPNPDEVIEYLSENEPDRVEVYKTHLAEMQKLTKILDDHSTGRNT